MRMYLCVLTVRSNLHMHECEVVVDGANAIARGGRVCQANYGSEIGKLLLLSQGAPFSPADWLSTVCCVRPFCSE